ncbi:MAG: hypothetical protein LBG17_04565 [Bacteroidales bacterium]|jgi:hypothetical protein|nr:hypothetical protein [Bacteroidales bacterium]
MAKTRNKIGRNKAGKYLLFILLLLAAIPCGYYLTRNEGVRRKAAALLAKEYIPNQNIDIESILAFKQADSLYSVWSKNFRFHTQSFFSCCLNDSSWFLILSEPPAFVTIDSIRAIFAEFNIRDTLLVRGIGVDGFGKDIQIIMANASKQNLKRLGAQLSTYFYGTDYKSGFEPVSGNYGKIYFADSNLNYFINLDELNSWFLEYNEKFTCDSCEGGVTTVPMILEQQLSGVFFSYEAGFTIWAMPRNTDLLDKTADIRKFTLDADLILGAISDDSTLVIIGRERVSPLNELPPLRVETIRLIASINSKELSQSLDINDLLAGKMEDGKDWCPTYLTPELENTEFGDLLTITDILLKDWSECGTIQEMYYRYPEPAYYPFRKPLFRLLGLNELVYNWNTANVMYAIDIAADKKPDSGKTRTIYAIDRTGSLPVSYFNSQQSYQSIGYGYENTAYNYFSNLNCTDLVRVVQYVALYQLFIDNNITYSGNTYPAIPKGKQGLLAKPVGNLLTSLRNMPYAALRVAANSISEEQFRQYIRRDMDRHLAQNEENYNFRYSPEQRAHIEQNVRQGILNDNFKGLERVKQIAGMLSDDDFNKLCRYLAAPRAFGYSSKTAATFHRGQEIQRIFRRMSNGVYKYLGLSVQRVKNSYTGALSKISSPYLKSASAVITFNDMLTTGGHNISSRITRVNRTRGYRHRSYNSGNVPRYTSPGTPSANPVAPPAERKPQRAGQQSAPHPPQSVKPAVRPRAAVIPTTARSHRGL